MKVNKLFGNSAVVTAFLASLCCITPVLAVIGGLSGIASTFSFLEPLRPYFIGLTALTLGFAFYNAYSVKPILRNKAEKISDAETDCECEPTTFETGGNIKLKKRNFMNSKKFLWIIALVSIVLITFPYYAKAIIPSNENSFQADSSEIVKVELKIAGMTCTGCEVSVDNLLKSETGVISAKSSYKTGLAEVEFDKSKVLAEQLKKKIENELGYKVTNVKLKED